MNGNQKKRSHPYAKLAIFTLAGASVINLYQKTKKLINATVKVMTEKLGK